MATPIGSHTHASPTLREVLLAADVIVAEDTRRLAVLLRCTDVVIAARVLPYFEGSEATYATKLTGAMVDGQDVVLVTDASTPSVSDPGYYLMAACVKRDLSVAVVPGSLAVLTMLMVSGLPCDRFCFGGFLSRKAGGRRVRLAGLTAEEHTMIFFEAPHRLHEWPLDAADASGADRRAVTRRELTKPHEEIVRDDSTGLAGWVASGARDEVIVVIAEAEPIRAGISDALELVASRIADGEKLSQAVRVVVDLFGIPCKELCEATLMARKKEQ